MKRIGCIFIVLLFFVRLLVAECPPLPGKKEFRPSRISPIRHLDRLQVKALAEGRALTLPATYKILVIRVEFGLESPDNSATTGTGKFESGTTKETVETFMSKLAAFYAENSYNQLVTSYTVTNIYSLTKKMAVYGMDSPYDQYDTLVSDILATSVSLDYTLSNYDHFMIYHAGAGQESDVDGTLSYDIWSAYVPDLGLSGAINEATFVPEKENQNADPLGVICHEYGHQLGLPDIYYPSASGQISTLGYWSLMDAGVWLGTPQGANPSHFDAWCKLDLGFITPQVVSGDASNLAFSPAETLDPTFYKIPISVADDSTKEFFLVEYRYRASGADYDKYIPGDGILVYHIDNAIAQNAARRENNDINSGMPHLGVDLEEADGTDSSNDYGSAGDAFGTSVTIFGDPLSRAYNGKQSGITLVLNASNGSGDMDAVSIDYRENMAILKVINYPNPTDTGQTTFHVRLTKPLENIDLFVYTMAGDKVINVEKNAFLFSSTKSSDYNWVYEYAWDGKNEGGEKIASGAYFYRVCINDDTIETGKLAVIK